MSSDRYNSFPIVSLNGYVADLSSGYGIKNDVIVSQIIDYDQVVDPTGKMSLENNHTYYEDNLLPDTEEIEHLKSVIVEIMSDITGRDYLITESWSIILESGQSISAHSHNVHAAVDLNEYFAFAYYPFAPAGSCSLQFLSTHSNTISTTVSAGIKTGTLLIFNSYLLHWTNRQMGGSDRVSVSGNLAPVSPTTVPMDDWSKYSKG